MLLWQLKYTCWGFLEAFCEINKSHHKLKLKSKKHTERNLAVMLVSRASKKRLHSVSTTVYNLPIFRLRSLNRRENKIRVRFIKMIKHKNQKFCTEILNTKSETANKLDWHQLQTFSRYLLKVFFGLAYEEMNYTNSAST